MRKKMPGIPVDSRLCPMKRV